MDDIFLQELNTLFYDIETIGVISKMSDYNKLNLVIRLIDEFRTRNVELLENINTTL